MRESPSGTARDSSREVGGAGSVVSHCCAPSSQSSHCRPPQTARPGSDAVDPSGQAVVRYQPPVDAPVTDPFRPPSTPYGPGNRGIEYATVPGTRVHAAADGVVVFAGPVAGGLHVTVLHRDGVRTTYSFLAAIRVSRGEDLRVGDVVGIAASMLHVGAGPRRHVHRPGVTVGPTGRAAYVHLARRLSARSPGTMDRGRGAGRPSEWWRLAWSAWRRCGTWRGWGDWMGVTIDTTRGSS